MSRAGVAEQFGDDDDGDVGAQQVGGEGVAEDVGGQGEVARVVGQRRTR
jgi:hypothetical protein